MPLQSSDDNEQVEKAAQVQFVAIPAQVRLSPQVRSSGILP